MFHEDKKIQNNNQLIDNTIVIDHFLEKPDEILLNILSFLAFSDARSALAFSQTSKRHLDLVRVVEKELMAAGQFDLKNNAFMEDAILASSIPIKEIAGWLLKTTDVKQVDLRIIVKLVYKIALAEKKSYAQAQNEDEESYNYSEKELYTHDSIRRFIIMFYGILYCQMNYFDSDLDGYLLKLRDYIQSWHFVSNNNPLFKHKHVFKNLYDYFKDVFVVSDRETYKTAIHNKFISLLPSIDIAPNTKLLMGISDSGEYKYHDFYVNFSGIALPGTNLSGRELRRYNFTGANLEGADMSFCKIEKCFLIRVNLRNANLNCSGIKYCIIKDTLLKNVSIIKTSFFDNKMKRINFYDALCGNTLPQIPASHSNGEISTKFYLHATRPITYFSSNIIENCFFDKNILSSYIEIDEHCSALQTGEFSDQILQIFFPYYAFSNLDDFKAGLGLFVKFCEQRNQQNHNIDIYKFNKLKIFIGHQLISIIELMMNENRKVPEDNLKFVIAIYTSGLLKSGTHFNIFKKDKDLACVKQRLGDLKQSLQAQVKCNNQKNNPEGNIVKNTKKFK